MEIINDRSFSGCKNIERITFPKNLRVISHFAFARCTKLKSVDFPKSLEKIGYRAFADCWDLESANFSSAPNVDSTAFVNCKYHFEYQSKQ